ncbi:MAG: hypothetical protein U1E11_03010 [Dethiobacteria bacterium]|nr:hypothetical protein [Dethiobacteria bacterium]
MPKFSIIDAHCDTVRFFCQEKSDYNFLYRNNQHHIDLPRLKESGIILQFFALYIKDEYNTGRFVGLLPAPARQLLPDYAALSR